MDSAVPTGYSSLVRRIGESSPGKCDWLFRCQTALGVGASRSERNRIPEFVAVGEELKNLGASRSESTMTRDVFGERRRRKRARLVGNPESTVKGLCSMETTPSGDLLTVKQIRDRLNRTHRVESAFRIPCGNAAVEDRVSQRKEHLGVIVDGVMVTA